MNKKIKILISLMGIVVLGGLLYFSRNLSFWGEMYTVFKLFKWTTLSLFVISILAICFIKALRFYLLLQFGGARVPFFKTVFIFISSQLFTVLPGGEVGRALLFKNKLHLEIDQVSAPVFIQAILEIWTAIFLALLCALFVRSHLGVIFGFGLFILLMIVSFLIFVPKLLSTFIDLLQRKGFSFGWLNSFKKIIDDSGAFIAKRNGKVPWKFLLLLVFLGILGHSFGGLLLYYIAHLQNIGLGILQSIFAAAIAVLIQGILGIIPGGLGVTEGGLIGVFSSFGITWNKSVLITLIYRILTLPLLLIIAAVFLLLLYLPKLFRAKEKTSI